MKTRREEEIVVHTIYIAEDGTEFRSENECKYHELKNTLRTRNGSVWVVYNKRPNQGCRPEVFSSEKNAKLSLKHVGEAYLKDFVIEELFIDMRFINMDMASAERQGLLNE